MRLSMSVSCMAAALFFTSVLSAQEAQAPQKEHAVLQNFVGEWESESEASMPGMPAIKCKGTMSGKMLGSFWMVSDVKGEMPGGMKMSALYTLGYDPEKKKYIGTWIDSAISHMWTYSGTLDETGKKITLEAEGPNFMEPGKLSKYRDIYEFKSKDHMTLTSEMQGADGKWSPFMKGNIRRKK